MVSTKTQDACARLPGNDGEDADAYKAYLQAFVADHEGNTETWIELPEYRWPKEWKGKYRRPMVRLLRNLYGSKLAGLFWERHCHNSIMKCGFSKVQGWECMYIHHAKQLCLSVYVDDLKMTGKAENIAPMWKEISKYLKLDPPTKFHNSVYLGCEQFAFKPTQADLDYQRTFYDASFADDHTQIIAADDTVLEELRESNLSKRAAKRAKKIAKEHGPSTTVEAPSSPRGPSASAGALEGTLAPSASAVAAMSPVPPASAGACLLYTSDAADE